MADETDILNSLIWGKTEKSLAKFLKNYELPLIVKVVNGFYCNNEDACIYDEQILALYKKHSTPKFIGTDLSGSQVSIPLLCPIPVLVYPAKCKHSPCKVEDFKSLFPKVQYIRVKSCGAEKANDGQEATSESSLKIGDFLQIKTIDTKNRNVLCQNVHTKDNLCLPYAYPATFTPLLHYRQYTLSEVVSNFSLPVKVTFEVTQTVQDSYEWNNALSGLTEVILHKEVTERTIIATTVGGVSGVKYCLGLPSDLPIRCTVPEPLTKYGGTFVDVTRWLRSRSVGLHSENIKERINVFDEKNIVKIYDFTFSDSPTTLRRTGAETLPGLVRNPARRLHAPQVSPRKKNSTLPQDSKHPRQGSSKDRSRSEPDTSATTDEVCYEDLSRSRSENSATIADLYEELSWRSVIKTSPTTSEDEYMDMASLNEKVYENSDFVMDKKLNTTPTKNPYLSKTLPNHNSSSSESSIKPTPLKNPGKKTMKSFIKRTQGYEEVEPKWNKQAQRQFAVPRINPGETRKEQFSQEDSEYVIPMIPENLQPKKFEIRQQPETKNQSSSGYENVDLNSERNQQEDKERKNAYENVFLKVESDSEKFENFDKDVEPRNIQKLKLKFENGPFASAEVMLMQFLHFLTIGYFATHA